MPLFFFYQLIIGLIFYLCFPVLLLVVLITGKHRNGLWERLGFTTPIQPAVPGGKRVWIHAASIGEVNAARIIISQLRLLVPGISFIITTMTIHGRDYCRTKVGQDIPCFLAPLDIPLIVDHVVHRFNPDVYVCLETELWPLAIMKIKRAGAAVVLLNGRISDKSIDGYQRIRFLMKPVIRCFDAIGAIGAVDSERFKMLGADPEHICITGNIKNAALLPDDHLEIEDAYRQLLQIDEKTDVFIAGSTHDPEETLLLPLYEQVGRKYNHLWCIAPRHLDRLDQIKQSIADMGIEYDLLSDCKGGRVRTHSLLLVDTFGDLAELYSVASFVFIGGSFTDYGGHNLLEAAIWGNVLFFGPNMQDFQDAADDLLREGGGKRVETPERLAEHLEYFSTNRAMLKDVSISAARAAGKKHNSGTRQAELVARYLVSND